MRTLWIILAVGAGLGWAADAAPARERLLTLYSPRIESVPFVHRTTTVALAPDGRHAPAEPGYILGFQEQDVPFTIQTRLTFDVILPLWGHRGPRPTPVSARANRSPLC